MVVAEIDFSREVNLPTDIHELDWLAKRLTGLFGGECPSFYADANKWILAESNDYWLHWDNIFKIAMVTSRYFLEDKEVAAIQTVIVSFWGLRLVEDKV